jgi:hypothetical protein
VVSTYTQAQKLQLIKHICSHKHTRTHSHAHIHTPDVAFEAGLCFVVAVQDEVRDEVRVATLGAVVPHAALQAGQAGSTVGEVHTRSGGVRGEGCDAMSDCRAPGACRQGISYVL